MQLARSPVVMAGARIRRRSVRCRSGTGRSVACDGVRGLGGVGLVALDLFDQFLVAVLGTATRLMQWPGPVGCKDGSGVPCGYALGDCSGRWLPRSCRPGRGCESALVTWRVLRLQLARSPVVMAGARILQRSVRWRSVAGGFVAGDGVLFMVVNRRWRPGAGSGCSSTKPPTFRVLSGSRIRGRSGVGQEPGRSVAMPCPSPRQKKSPLPCGWHLLG